MPHARGELWTEEMIDQLRALKAEGKVAREIAEIMGLSRDTINKAWGRYGVRQARPVITPSVDAPTLGLIPLAEIAAALDTRGSILKEIETLALGMTVDEAELARRVCGTDKARFNRAKEVYAAEFKGLRIKIKINREADEPRWVWGKEADIKQIKNWRDL